MGGHRKYAASSAHRWTACTASHALEAAIPDRPSRFAAEGTRAHAFAAYLLEGNEQLEIGSSVTYIDGDKEIETIVDAETLNAIAPYLDFVRNAVANGATDLRVEFSTDLIPGKLGGTTDAVFMRRDTLHVCDLKYGKGVLVDPTENAQLMIYALGCLPFYPGAKQVCLNIIQPRARGEIVKQWRCPIARLNDFFIDVREAAIDIEANDTHFKRGEHCRFCKAFHGCPSYLDLVTDDKLRDSAHVLDHLDEIRALCTAVEKEAIARLHSGESVPGWKLVNKQGKSKWTAGAETEIAQLYPDLMIPKLIGITEARKLLGNAIDAYVTKSAEIAMVRESDARPAIAAGEMLDDIGEIENEQRN